MAAVVPNLRGRGHWLLTLALTLSCTPPPQPVPDDGGIVCDGTAPTSCTQPALVYTDIKPITDTHCVPCHNGASVDGPWPIKTWSDLADWQDTIRDDLVNCSMPPDDAGTRMTNAERRKVLDWLKCGLAR